jgi:putative peptidoglycan lipid II flippase
MLPASVGLALIAYPLVESVLQYGALSAESAEQAAGVLTAMALGLPGFSLFLLVVRSLQAMRDTRSVFVLYAFENLLNIGLALLLRQHGVAGLGAAFAIAYSSAAIASALLLHRRLGDLLSIELAKSMARMVLSGVAMGVAVAAVVWSDVLDTAIVEVVASVLVGAIVYGGAAYLLGIPELRSMIPRKWAKVNNT